MRVTMHINAEPIGESFIRVDGERMFRFPWPEGINHDVPVPVPLQAGDPPLHQGPLHDHTPGGCCTAGLCGLFAGANHKRLV